MNVEVTSSSTSSSRRYPLLIGLVHNLLIFLHEYLRGLSKAVLRLHGP